MFNKRFTRITIGIILLIFLIVAFTPNLFISNSSDGIINARTTVIRSPIAGVLEFAKPTKCGMVFKHNEQLAQIVNERVNRAHLHELTTEKRTLESRQAALSERLTEYAQLDKRLEESMSKYRKHASVQLEYQIKQTEDKLNQEKAEFERSRKEFDANRTLVDRQAVKKREFETSEASFSKSTSRIRELENRLGELKNSLEAVNAGIFLGDGNNDVPYSRQRRDQLVIEISQAKTAMAEARDRMNGINEQIKQEDKRLQKMACHPIIAPFDGLVWRLVATEASSIVIDSELMVLLDSNSIFLDFCVSEGQFSDVKPGDSVRFRLVGESQYHKAKIFALRGSGSNLTDMNIAAGLSRDPKREFHIWAEIPRNELNCNAENFYQVGRRAEVKVPRKWNVWREIVRFFNVF